MADKILNGFLAHQYEQGMALARESDILDLCPSDGPRSQRYGVSFN